MKTVLAALACSALLVAATASAQTGETVNANTPRGTATNPRPPASHPAPGETSRQTAQQDKCRKQADDKNLSGQARTNYLHHCQMKAAPR